MRSAVALLALALVLVGVSPALGGTGPFWVATDGSDGTGDGSVDFPWATITHALDSVPDGSLVLVRPGLYEGRIRLRGTFPIGVTVRSEVPYQAQLRHDDRVITAYTDPAGCEGITIERFDIAHTGPGSAPLVVHVDGGGDGSVSRITFRDNVIHDSWDNDLLKINNATFDVLVEGNMFYNQSGSDEHIDVNSVEQVTIQDNVFFNDFEGSGRPNDNDTSSFIVVKDSNAGTDDYLGSRFVTVRRNVFLNWQGSTGSNFVLLGEDGQSFYEARDVTIENNLMLGNSVEVMRASFGVKGGRDVTFRHNTVVGDLPSSAFAMRLNVEGSNPPNDEIDLRHNIWSDPTGSMGATSPGGSDDFSDTPPGETLAFTLDRNLYWNGLDPVPEDPAELVNPSDDLRSVIADPFLPSQSGLVLPRYRPGPGTFADGSSSIRSVFRRLVERYARFTAVSPAVDAADPLFAANEDILGTQRGSSPDLGAWESGLLTDGFESGDTTAWSSTTP